MSPSVGTDAPSIEFPAAASWSVRVDFDRFFLRRLRRPALAPWFSTAFSLPSPDAAGASTAPPPAAPTLSSATSYTITCPFVSGYSSHANANTPTSSKSWDHASHSRSRNVSDLNTSGLSSRAKVDEALEPQNESLVGWARSGRRVPTITCSWAAITLLRSSVHRTRPPTGTDADVGSTRKSRICIVTIVPAPGSAAGLARMGGVRRRSSSLSRTPVRAGWVTSRGGTAGGDGAEMSLGGRSTSNCWLWRTRISVCILFVRRARPKNSSSSSSGSAPPCATGAGLAVSFLDVSRVILRCSRIFGTSAETKSVARPPGVRTPDAIGGA